MSRTGLSSWSLLLPLALLLQSCSILPSWMWTHYYEVEVTGSQPESTHSLFLIVADKDPLDGDHQDLLRLIRAEMIGKYLLFAQFDPESGKPMRWRRQSVRGNSEQIRIEVSKDESLLTLLVDKDLLDAYRDLTVVAVGHGVGGWYSEVLDAGKIRNEDGMRLEIGAARFMRRAVGGGVSEAVAEAQR